MTTENQPPASTNGDVDQIIDEALASVPTPPAPVPGSGTQTPEAPATTPDLGVPAPDTIPEGSAPPADAPPAPLSADALALQERDAQIAELQRTNQERDTLLQQFQTQQRDAQIQQATAGIAQRLVEEGLTSETANQYAQALAQSQMQGQQAAREEAGRIAAARHYGQAHGVSPDVLMNLPSPEAMETAAKQEARINALEKQLTQSKQAELPTQKFDSGLGLSASMTEAQKSAASGRGEYQYTPEEEEQRRTAALAKINR